MNGLDALLPGVLVGKALLQVTVVTGAALLLSYVFLRRRASTRHAVCLAALLVVAVTPVLAVLGHGVRTIGIPARTAVAGLEAVGVPGETAQWLLGVEIWPANETDLQVMVGVVDVVHVIAIVWAAGSFLLLLRLMLGAYIQARVRRHVRPVDIPEPVMEQVRNALIEYKLPRIVASDRVSAPAAIGGGDPLVVLPAGLVDALEPDQLRDVLIHECGHVAHRDHKVGLFQRIVSIVFWPHLLIHWVNRVITRAREEVCDNHVLEGGEPGRYGNTLIRVSERTRGRRPLPIQIGMTHPAIRLRARVLGLMARGRRLATWVSPAFVVVTALLFLTAAVAVGGIYIRPPLFTAEAVIRREDPTVLMGEGAARGGTQIGDNLAVTRSCLLQTGNLVRILTSDLYGIRYDQILGVTGDLDDPRSVGAWERELPRIRNRIGIGIKAQAREGQVQILSIRYTCEDRGLALKVCGALAEEYKKTSREAVFDHLMRSIRTLAEQANGLREGHLRPIQAVIRRFEDDHLGEELKDFGALSAEKKQLDADVDSLVQTTKRLIPSLERLKKRLAETPRSTGTAGGLTPNQRMDQIDAEIRRREVELGSLRRTLTEKHPTVRAKEEAIEVLRQRRADLSAEVEAPPADSVNPAWVQLDLLVTKSEQELSQRKDALATKVTERQRFERRWRAVLARNRQYRDLKDQEEKLVSRIASLEDAIARNQGEVDLQQRERGIRFEVVQRAVIITPTEPEPFLEEEEKPEQKEGPAEGTEAFGEE